MANQNIATSISAGTAEMILAPEAEIRRLLSVGVEKVNTEKAAQLLNRRPQTLYVWSSKENGPIRAIHLVGSRDILWPLAEIAAYYGMTPSPSESVGTHSQV